MAQARTWIPTLSPVQRNKYVGIFQSLSDAIVTGELRPGDRLLPQRELAWRLGVNVSTVTRAYLQAERDGLIGGEVGRGTFVLPPQSSALFPLPDNAPDVIDLSPSTPVRLADEQSICEAAAALSAAEQQMADEYHSETLIKNTRKAVARWLEWRGYSVNASQVTPCAGTYAALAILLAQICRREDRILVEAFTSPSMKLVSRQFGYRLVGVRCDTEGMISHELARAARSSRAGTVVLMANCQNPTGSTMGEQRRHELRSVLRKEKLLLIENDDYGSFSDKPPLCAEDGVEGFVVSSLSKAVLPGLRFGFIVDPRAGAPCAWHSSDDVSPSTTPLGLLIGSRWIADGTATRRAELQKSEARARRRIMSRILGLESAGESPNVWLDTPFSNSAEALVACLTSGVRVVPSSVFAVSRKDAGCMRVCLNAPGERRELAEGLRRLGTVLGSNAPDASYG